MKIKLFLTVFYTLTLVISCKEKNPFGSTSVDKVGALPSGKSSENRPTRIDSKRADAGAIRKADIGDLPSKWTDLGALSLAESTEARCALIAELAQRGFHSEVLQFILQNSNPGEIRRNYLVALFSSSDGLNLLKLEDSIALLSEDQDKKSAMEGILYALNTGIRIHQFSEFAALPSNSFGYAELLKNFTTDSIRWGIAEGGQQIIVDNFRSIVKNLESLKGSNHISDDLFYQTVAELVTQNPLLGREAYVSFVTSSAIGNVPDNIKLKIIRTAAADVGVSFLDTMKDNPQLVPADWRAAFLELAKRDSVALAEWKLQNLNDPAILASYYTAVSEFNLNKGSIEDARKAAAEISDPSQKEKIEGVIWEKERSLLNKDVNSNPAGTVQSIVSGQSKYADYWLEEAMGTWVAKDFAKAQEWYETNWNSLPVGKSQYVAAAFANQAASQGDITAARQWADLIQDAKTKQRIVAAIAKMEATAKP